MFSVQAITSYMMDRKQSRAPQEVAQERNWSLSKQKEQPCGVKATKPSSAWYK